MDEVGRAAVALLLPYAEVIDLDEARGKARRSTIPGLEDGTVEGGAALEIRTPDLRITSPSEGVQGGSLAFKILGFPGFGTSADAGVRRRIETTNETARHGEQVLAARITGPVNG